MHWWGNYHLIAIVVFILGLGFVYAVYQRRLHYFMHLTVFAFLLIFFLIFFERYMRPRYVIYALPFFIPLVAESIEALIDYTKKSKPLLLQVVTILAVGLFLFQTFNYQNILYPVTSREHGYVKTTDEHHDFLKSISEILEREMEPEDVFITTVFGVRWHYRLG